MTGVDAARAMSLSRGRAASLYHQHCADAVRLAYLLTGNRYLAEDLAQDAFVRAFGRFQDLRRPDAFAPYLRRTIVNLSKDHFRRMQRERALSTREHTTDGEEDGRLGLLGVRDELLHALQFLPPRQRAAVVLRYCEDLSEHETAEVLGASVGAINSLVSRGLTVLREHMRGKR